MNYHHCPICGESWREQHRCDPRKLANIERGRLTEITRQEKVYRRVPSFGELLELGELLLSLVDNHNDQRPPGEFPLACSEEYYHVDGTSF